METKRSLYFRPLWYDLSWWLDASRGLVTRLFVDTCNIVSFFLSFTTKRVDMFFFVLLVLL